MGGGEIARYLSRHGAGRTARVVLISSTVPRLHVDPQAAAALLGTLRTGYGQWVEENAARSFGDERPGCEVPRLDQEQAIRDWMGVSLDAAVACMTANLAADFTAELSSVDVPALIVHGDHDAFAPLAACGRRSAELMPGSRLLVYAGGGAYAPPVPPGAAQRRPPGLRRGARCLNEAQAVGPVTQRRWRFGMDVGIGLPNAVPDTEGRTLVDWARQADEAGFSTLGTIGLVYPNYEELVSLAAAAAVTSRIRLTTSVLLSPLHSNAALFAKQAASIDRISGGRLVLGLGIGGREDDFSASGLTMAGRGRRFDEQLDEMKRIWAGEGRPASTRSGRRRPGPAVPS